MKLGIKLGFVGYLADIRVGVEQANLTGERQVAAGNFLRAFNRKRDGLRFIGQNLKAELF